MTVLRNIQRYIGRTASVLMFCIAATSASAEMPDYDVEAHCTEVANIGGGGSEMIKNECDHEEQASYDHLKPVWDDLPAQIRAHCDDVARVGGGGSYMILSECIREETQAEQQNEQFQFHR